MGRASGWLGRAQRLVEREEGDCLERGYLLFPPMFQHEASGDYAAAAANAAEATEIGERFGDADLFALAVHSQGLLLIKQGRVAQGLGLLDEAMVAVTAGELSPIVSGLVYCGVILGCQDAYEMRRAQEWTAALTKWCEAQPDMVSFTGTCLVHRAEIMQLYGAWPEAIAEAQRAGERCALVKNQSAAAQACYRQGEIHRLQGRFAEAEEAYGDASQCGWEPQPGLALLRLAQGRTAVAAAAIRRAVSESQDRLQRTRLLPAYVEIMLAMGEIEEARGACRELAEIAQRFDTAVLGAVAAQARGAAELAEGNAQAALGSLRHAFEVWRQIEAPYEAARVRVLLGLACCALGDDDGGRLELDAARVVFAQLGAAPDLARIDALTRSATPACARGLSARELQVLRLVAAGKTNKVIAAELFVSEKTVDRHVSNIFTKLNVPSRAAATAYAYENKLI